MPRISRISRIKLMNAWAGLVQREALPPMHLSVKIRGLFFKATKNV
jgi:hypothetical protein